MDSDSKMKCDRGAQVENCGHGEYIRDNYVKCFLRGRYNNPEDQGVCTCPASWINLNMSKEPKREVYSPICVTVGK